MIAIAFSFSVRIGFCNDEILGFAGIGNNTANLGKSQKASGVNVYC